MVYIYRTLCISVSKYLQIFGSKFKSNSNIRLPPVWRLSLFNNKVELLKPTGHVMHQQFNIQQLYALTTLYLCVLYLSENKQRLVPLTA